MVVRNNRVDRMCACTAWYGHLSVTTGRPRRRTACSLSVDVDLIWAVSLVWVYLSDRYWQEMQIYKCMKQCHLRRYLDNLISSHTNGSYAAFGVYEGPDSSCSLVYSLFCRIPENGSGESSSPLFGNDFLLWQWSSEILDGLLQLLNKAQRPWNTHQTKYYFQVTVMQF